MLDDRQDYFGLSVNIASRVQELADPTAILATKPVVDAAEAAGLVGAGGYRTSSRQLSLRGVSEAFTIYEIRERERAARPREGIPEGRRANREFRSFLTHRARPIIVLGRGPLRSRRNRDG